MRTVLVILLLGILTGLVSCGKNETTAPKQEETIRNAEMKFSSTDNRLLTGVCYYPWYTNKDHWKGDNLRENLLPSQMPVLGKYDCIDQTTISQHVKWSLQAGIDFWISSWWGQGSSTDNVILQGQLKNPDFQKNMGYCLLYEPKDGVPINVNDTYISRFLSNLDYMAKNHFNSPNYLKIDNKPVLYIYLTRTMQGDYKRLFQSADTLLQNRGYAGLYVVGDEVYWREFSQDHLNYMEAVTAYNPHISESWVSDPVKFVSRTKTELYDPWMAIVNKSSKSLWVDVLPGFNDLGVRKDMQHPVIPRDSVNTFINFLNSAKIILKNQTVPLKVLVVTSWNEWHEDSQIEPVAESVLPAQKPFELTKGFWYHGYGTSCLDILGNFKKDFQN
ncbi:MAG: glycoside hydrolase family 99-like domain-containing protein [Syntrophomonadaceae bacterium]